MTSVLIADDHELIRTGIRLLLEKEEDIRVAGEVSTFTQLRQKIEETGCDLLILDLNLGDRNGVETVEGISALFPSLPILVLSSFPEEQYALQSFRAGASGYLNKTVFSGELLRAIRKIASGKKYVSESLAETLVCGVSLEKSSRDPLELLSRREFEVLTRICTGRTYKEIADELGLSPKTVSTYRTRLLEKLELTSTVQLVHYAFEHHLCSS